MAEVRSREFAGFGSGAFASFSLFGFSRCCDIRNLAVEEETAEVL